MMGCGQCGGVCDTCRQADLQLQQALSKGKLEPDDLFGGWWNRYLIDNDRVQIGYDLTDWALPIKLGFGTRSLYAQVLCFDFNFWWGETL